MKTKLRVAFAAAVTALCLAGCASNFGSEPAQDFGKYLALKPNVSSKAFVFETFGQPHDVLDLQASNESMWIYYSVSTHMSAATFVPIVGLFAGGNDMDTKIADFYFDKNGLFLKTETLSKSQYVNQWVAMGTAFGSNMAAGVTGKLWEMNDLVAMIEEWEGEQRVA